MTPTTAELLVGNLLALANAPPPESAGAYGAGMVGVTGMIAVLAAQEAERGVAVRVAENAAIRAALGVPAAEEPDLGVTALDAANAELRRALIAAHEAAEAEGDTARDRAFLTLYQRMADWRRLELPSLLGA